MRTRHILLVAAIAVVALAPARAFAQADVVISQRQPPVCNPNGTTPYVYYNSVDGKWHCTATAPKVVFGGDVSTPTATAIGGMTDPSSTTSGTVQNTEYVLNSVTLKANSFNANGRGVHCTAWGTTAANANAKNVKFYFGATAVVTVTGSTASGKDYTASIDILRTGASTQTGRASVQIDTAVAPSMAVSAALAETDTAQIVVSIKSANTAAAAASATGKGMSCEVIN